MPLENVDRIELVDGTSSSVYGNYAMGGVINFMSARPRPRTVELRTQYGNKNSPKADFVASDVWGKVGVSVEGSAFTTDGFPQVIANERGRVDTMATVDYRNFALKVDYSPTAARERVRPGRLLPRGARQRQDHHDRHADAGGQRHDVEVA